MTTRGQITKHAQDEGVTAQVVERDYVLAHAVAAIAAADRDQRLVFKGGTSLRLLHFDDYRYSADLDYSVTAGSATDAALRIESALAASTGPVAMRSSPAAHHASPTSDRSARNERSSST